MSSSSMRIKYSSSTTRRRGVAEEFVMADLPPCNSVAGHGFHRLCNASGKLSSISSKHANSAGQRGLNVSKRPRNQQDDDHMEFLLTLRRRGIADQAVLRAMDEVPREYFVETAFARQRLCRPGSADRLRPDHQPALRRGLHDRAAQCGSDPSCPGDRHRLRLSGGRPVAPGSRSGDDRALSHARRSGARTAQGAWLRQCRGCGR